MRTRGIPSLMPRSTRIEKWLCGRGKVASTNESEARRVVLFANRYRRERSFHDLFTVLVFESAHLHSLYTFINFVNSKVFEREGGKKMRSFISMRQRIFTLLRQKWSIFSALKPRIDKIITCRILFRNGSLRFSLALFQRAKLDCSNFINHLSVSRNKGTTKRISARFVTRENNCELGSSSRRAGDPVNK